MEADKTVNVLKNTKPAHLDYKFLPKGFTVSTWAKLKPYFDQLLARKIKGLDDLKEWLSARSELDAVLSEDIGWRYIKMTCFTENETYRNAYKDFMQHIQPHISSFSHLLNKKIVASPYAAELEKEANYVVTLRNIREGIKIFKEENIPLYTQIDTTVQKYGQVTGAMTVTHNNKEITLQQAGVLLMDTDRAVREEVYKKIMQRRMRDKDALNALFSDLVGLRHRVALNAGFNTFRDYMFSAYCRFDYTPQDCIAFHKAVASEVVPLLNTIALQRKKDIGVERLKPWDKVVDAKGRKPLKAFLGGDDLIRKTIECFSKIDPFLGQCLTTMNNMKHLDLNSRKGKAPGGYNYPLPATGIPFIFMNATSTLRDMVTIIHEGGHAIHNFLTMDMDLLDFKSPPMEVAELASMSMELISMDYWDVFFTDKEELKRAKQEHLEGIVETLPWVAVIDKYQHWIYENPSHTSAERSVMWNKILDEFTDSVTDWSGLQEQKNYLWQKQLHLYEVPLYYIEYGIAQLGAIAIWCAYKQNPAKGLKGYLDALRVGNTRSIPAIYEKAHVRFDFSQSYIKELIGFVKQEMGKF